MMGLGIFLVILSPYTAFVPVLYAAVSVYRNRYALLHNPAVLKNPWNIALLFLFMWAAAVGFVNVDRLSLLAAFFLLGYLSLSVYFQLFYNTEEKVEHLIRRIQAFSILPALLGLAEKAASLYVDMTWISRFFWSPTYVPDPEAHRIYSTFGNPNIAGAWFATMVLVSYYFFEKETGRKKILYLLSAVLFAVVMAFTGSRGAVLGLVSGFIVMACFRRNQGNLLPLGMMFGFVVALTLFIPEISHPLNSREYIWDICKNMFLQKPLSGWGLLGIYRYSGEIHGHNIWFTVAASLGLVGLAAYFHMKFSLVKGIFFLYRNNIAITPLLAAVQALIIGHGIVDFTILVPQGGLIFFAGASMIFALSGELTHVVARKETAPVWLNSSNAANASVNTWVSEKSTTRHL